MNYRIFIVLLLSLFCISAASKSNKASLKVLTEATSTDGKFAVPITLINPPKKTFMSLMPLVTEKDIDEFYPFDAGDGTSGAYFRLGNHGSNLLEQYTMSSRGNYLIVMVNGRHVIDLLVDGPVHDRILVIPRGLLPSDIISFAGTTPIMGQPTGEGRRRTKELQKTLTELLEAEKEKSKPVKSEEPSRNKKPPKSLKPQKTQNQ